MDNPAYDAYARYRMNTRAAAREANVHLRGTSNQSPKVAHRSPPTERHYLTDGEDSESSDSGSSDSEQIDKEIKKIQKYKSRLSNEAVKGSSHAQPSEIQSNLKYKANSRYNEATKGSNYTQPTEFQNNFKYKTNSGLFNEAPRDNTQPQSSEIQNNWKYKTNSGLITEATKGSTYTQPTEFQNSWNYKTNSGLINEATKGNTYTFSCVLIVVIILFVATVIGCYSSSSLETRKSQLKDKFREIRKQFPTQEDDLWLTLFAGIKKVEEEDPSQPSTFLLLHEGEEDETPKCLAVKMSKAATAFLEAADPSPLKLRGEELGVNDSLIKDHGVLISEQKENITNHRAVIVFNLHKIPASVAQSFHYFCDEYNPVVQKAVYFFTMSVSKKLNSSPTYVAESELRKLWQQQLESDKLQPLIVRLTTSVMMIKPEEGLTSSCDL